MRSLNSRSAARSLDRAWDALIAGAPLAAADADPSLVATLERLHALDAAADPSPDYVDRLKARLLPAASGAFAAPPRRDEPAIAQSLSPRWRWAAGRVSPVMELAAAVLLLLLIGSYFASSRILTHSTTAPGESSVGLYVSSPFAGTDPLKQVLTPLDPATLRDLSGQPSISLADPKASPTWAEWEAADPSIAFAASADGSTIAQIEPVWTGVPPVGPDTTVVRGANSANASTIVIRDAHSGAIRKRISVPALAEYPILSSNGSRVIVQTGPFFANKGHFWTSFDTTSGHQLPVVNFGVADIEATAVNPAGTRLYVLIGHDSTTPYPQPAELDVYDLTLGRKIANATLETIPAGWVTYGKTPDGQWIQRDFAPGLAIAPDGKTLAIAHAESDAITLLNAASLKKTRTFTPKPEMSLVDRLFAWLPLAPRDAVAKEEASDIGRYTVFSADAQTLYVVSHWTRAGQYNGAGGSGLQAIDLASGSVTGILPDLPVDTLLSAPDGQTLYVFGPQPTNTGYELLRLNRAMLATQAVRGFNDLGPRWVVLTAGNEH